MPWSKNKYLRYFFLNRDTYVCCCWNMSSVKTELTLNSWFRTVANIHQRIIMCQALSKTLCAYFMSFSL